MTFGSVCILNGKLNCNSMLMGLCSMLCINFNPVFNAMDMTVQTLDNLKIIFNGDFGSESYDAISIWILNRNCLLQWSFENVKIIKTQNSNWDFYRTKIYNWELSFFFKFCSVFRTFTVKKSILFLIKVHIFQFWTQTFTIIDFSSTFNSIIKA